MTLLDLAHANALTMIGVIGGVWAFARAIISRIKFDVRIRSKDWTE